MHSVYSTVRLPGLVLERLGRTCDVTCREGGGKMPPEEFASIPPAVEGLISPSDQPVPREFLQSAPSLRVVSNIGVGYDNVDLAVAAERGIKVTNTPGVLSAAVAELTIGMMITLTRRLQESAAIVRDGRWGAPGVFAPLGTDLKGKTLGIVGFGRIGREVATRAAAFGMEVVFFDARPDVGGGAYRRAASLADLLREADVVTVHTDLNETSRHLIGADQLQSMKPSAHLINTARGGVLDQAALYEALRAGRIAGAALDVLEREPPDPTDPILQLPNVYVLPHIGSATRETRAAMLDLAIENLLACLDGRPCDNTVTS
jgi:glyoxylate reductase